MARRPHRDRLRGGCAAFACAAAAGAPATAFAGVWGATPEFSAGGDYSDNPQLVTDSPQAGEAATLRVGLPLDWNGDSRHLRIAPRARLGAAGGNSSLGANGFYLETAADYAWDVSKLSGSAQFSDDSSVIRQPDAGTLTRTGLRQHQAREALDWSTHPTERTQLLASVSFDRLSYGRRPDVGLYDYRYRSLVGQLSRRASERVTLEFIAGRSHYELPERAYHEDSTFQQAGLSGQINPLWSYRATWGRSRVSPVAYRQRPTGTVYNLSLSRESERLSATASIVRSLQPSGFGVIAQSKESNVRVSWALSERKSTFAAWRGADTGSEFATFVLARRRYSVVSAGLTWQVAEHWDLNLELNRTRANFSGGSASVAPIAQGTGASIAIARQFGRLRLT